MAFVVEHIPEAAIKGFLSEHRVYNGKAHPLSSRWVIDHERNAVMVLTGKLGGPYEGTQLTKCYSLYWKGEQVQLAADPLEKDYTANGAVVNWRVHALRMPDALQGQREGVLALIRDAFRAIGEVFDGDRYADVNVRFDLPSTN